MLSDRRYIAEPKLDGQRSQVHIRDGRTVACYSRPGRDLLRPPGMEWLRTVEWLVSAAVLDCEAYAGDGHPSGLRGAQPDGRGHQLSRLRHCSNGMVRPSSKNHGRTARSGLRMFSRVPRCPASDSGR